MKRLFRKRTGTFLGKYPWCSPVLIKSQGNVIKAGLRHWHFPRIFLTFYSEDPFCGAYVIFFFWSLDVFLVFDGEVLLSGLSKLTIQRSSEEQLLWKFWEKNAQGRLLFSKVASSLSRACNFTLSKVFTILILSSSLITLAGFTFCFI